MIVSSYTLAAFFATPLVMWLGWKTGRRLILLAGCALVRDLLHPTALEAYRTALRSSSALLFKRRPSGWLS